MKREGAFSAQYPPFCKLELANRMRLIGLAAYFPPRVLCRHDHPGAENLRRTEARSYALIFLRTPILVPFGVYQTIHCKVPRNDDEPAGFVNPCLRSSLPKPILRRNFDGFHSISPCRCL